MATSFIICTILLFGCTGNNVPKKLDSDAVNTWYFYIT
jgi:hypothetical protein